MAGSMFWNGQGPEQQPDVSLVPPVRLLDLLTAPCAYPVTGKNGCQFHGVLSCDIAPNFYLPIRCLREGVSLAIVSS